MELLTIGRNAVAVTGVPGVVSLARPVAESEPKRSVTVGNAIQGSLAYWCGRVRSGVLLGLGWRRRRSSDRLRLRGGDDVLTREIRLRLVVRYRERASWMNLKC